MTYRLEVAPDARSQWLALDLGIQEAVLDLLDDLAGGTENLPVNNLFVRDTVIDRGGTRHYLFVTLWADRTTRTLLVLGVSHLAK